MVKIETSSLDYLDSVYNHINRKLNKKLIEHQFLESKYFSIIIIKI
jgi:hypothetical protein